jgi:hypothetical protein
MSRTLRLADYRKGKPVYTRREGQTTPYRFYRHEHVKERRALNKSKRMKVKAYFKRTREVLKIPNTNGWETW